jgi:hypothetical protein
MFPEPRTVTTSSTLSSAVICAVADKHCPATVGVGVAVPGEVGLGVGEGVAVWMGVGVPGTPTEPHTGHSPRDAACASCSADAIRAWYFKSSG